MGERGIIMYMRTPSACIQKKPAKNTVYLGGKPVNVTAIARAQNMDQSYLSRVLSGSRQPTILTAQKIAAALGVGLEELLDMVSLRKAELAARARKELSAYRSRIAREDASDLTALKQGKPVPPRLPSLRVKSA
jgi:transcriptional regulator with XRE-family HTH domain